MRSVSQGGFLKTEKWWEETSTPGWVGQTGKGESGDVGRAWEDGSLSSSEDWVLGTWASRGNRAGPAQLPCNTHA